MTDDATLADTAAGRPTLGPLTTPDGDGTVAGEWRTYAQSAYDEIRARILSGQLEPGARIVVRVLSEELGLSPTPIKTALASLEREGFLHSVAYRGYSVPQTDLAAVAESFEVMAAMDMLAVRRIMARPDCAAVTDMLRGVVSQQWSDFTRGSGADRRPSSGETAAPGARRSSRSFELNFHKLLWDRSGNRQLATVADHQRGLILVASGGLPEPQDRRRQVLEEHTALLDAMADDDLDAALVVCRTHMTVSAKDAIDRLATRNRP